MVVMQRGVLVTCDPATMEILLQMNTTRDFIIEKLSDMHVLAKDVVFDYLEDEVTHRLEVAERHTSLLVETQAADGAIAPSTRLGKGRASSGQRSPSSSSTSSEPSVKDEESSSSDDPS
eukprot:GHVT01066647.1.p1 GENE.GHVT01066647.1~~GHVT01066647.1.p1  ORF type:complete len:119 (+),score=20.51 GHVT01066647.1:917-1273(+)